MEGTEGHKRLVLAVEELVKAAAISEVQTDTKTVVDAIQDLKGQTQSKLDTFISDTKADTEEVVAAIEDMKDTLMWEFQKQNLAWAITNAELFSFDYYFSTNFLDRKNSADMVRNILVAFRKKLGYPLDERSGMQLNGKSEESQKQFREKIQRQIYDLTGTNPVIKRYESYYAIYMA